jgi:hypothetical protein
MALAFSEGSIGGDIERAVNLPALAAFYGVDSQPSAAPTADIPWSRDRAGSNGIAIAPANARDGHALLLITATTPDNHDAAPKRGGGTPVSGWISTSRTSECPTRIESIGMGVLTAETVTAAGSPGSAALGARGPRAARSL